MILYQEKAIATIITTFQHLKLKQNQAGESALLYISWYSQRFLCYELLKTSTVAAVSNWLVLRKHRKTKDIPIFPALINFKSLVGGYLFIFFNLQPLSQRRNVASLLLYFLGKCSDDQHSLVSPVHTIPIKTHHTPLAGLYHPHSFRFLLLSRKCYLDSLFPRAASLYDSIQSKVIKKTLECKDLLRVNGTERS